MLVVYVELDAVACAYFQAFPVHWAPPAYRPRLLRKKHKNAFVQSIAGIWLLRKALKHIGHQGLDIQDIAIDAQGRPRLPSGPAFSISHSDHFAACAIAEPMDGATRIGIDIEESRIIAPARMARLLSSDAERAAVVRQPARFFDFWCAREATVKASGRVGLKRMRQTRLSDGAAWLDDRRWTLQPLSLAPGLAACLASDAPASTAIQVKRQTLPHDA